jgi:hypothetical protein
MKSSIYIFFILATLFTLSYSQVIYAYTHHHSSSKTWLEPVKNNTNNTTTPTIHEMMDYQILVWTSIVLVVSLVLALFAVDSIDYSKDTLLYVTQE